MKKPYIHIKELDIPIYRGKLVIIFTNDTISLKKQLPNFKDERIYAHAFYDNWKGNQGYIAILNFDNSHSKISHGTITHESIHLTHFICLDKGIQADLNNDEPITYLAGWITNEIYKFAAKKKFKPSLVY